MPARGFRIPIVDRLWPKVTPEPMSGCWLWTAGLFSDGYGQFAPGGRGAKPLRAHRVVYELLVGPIPEGLTLDHLCRNKACVNPLHLEPVTVRVNILRSDSPVARNARKTHCKQGHPFDETNTYRYSGKRGCLICRQARSALYNQNHNSGVAK